MSWVVGTADERGMIMSQDRALVADDNRTMADYVRSLLLKMGYGTVDVVLDGGDALKMIGSRRYDLIVLDNNMPSINGLDIIRGVRRSMPHQRAVIVLMTGLVDRRLIDTIRAENLGVDAVFAKPFDAETFTRKIESKTGKGSSARFPAIEERGRCTPAPALATAAISANRDGDLFAIRFAGTVTHNDKRPMKQVFDRALADGEARLAVDVSEVISFDEFFLGFLLVFCGTAAERTRNVTLITGPRTPTSRLFALGVDRIVPAVTSLVDLHRSEDASAA